MILTSRMLRRSSQHADTDLLPSPSPPIVICSSLFSFSSGEEQHIFFNSHDREFHVASLRYKPDFKVMPEGWDGTTRDPDEVLYEISMKEDQRLYEEFVQRLNFNKKKVAGEVKCHKYSRRRPTEGWNFTVEKLGPRDRRGGGGGWKFVSLPDGSSRALNDMEKMYVKRETPKPRKRILPPFK